MPAGQSITGIFNIAMSEIGEDPVTSPDQQVNRAIKAKLRYDDVRQATLRDAPWNCAKKLAQLSASPAPPLFGYGNAFPLPNDFIRVVYVVQDSLFLPPISPAYTQGDGWEVVGNAIYTDLGAPLNLVYIFDLTDPTRFDAKLAQAVGYALALEIAPGIVRDDSRLARIEKKLEMRLSESRFVSAQERSPREFDNDVLLASRA